MQWMSTTIVKIKKSSDALFFLFHYMKNYMKNLGFVLVLVGLASIVLAACSIDKPEYNLALFLAVLAFVTGGLVLWLDFSEETAQMKADREYWNKNCK